MTAADRHQDAIEHVFGPHAWPRPLDLQAMLSNPPVPPRMVIDDWFPKGYATLLAGHGGAGKSSLALHLACCIATGQPWHGLSCAAAKVLYLSCEDRADVIHWRLARICAHEGMDALDLAGRLSIVDLVGRDSILYRRDPQTGSGITAAYSELERTVFATQAEVLFVDGVADTFGASENDRSEVKSYVNSLVRLTGTEGAVVLIHHVNKPAATAGSTSEGYSGSTAWHNSVRARWYLYPEIERTDEGTEATGDLILALQKSNLGRSDQTMRIRWSDEARMFIAEGQARVNTDERDEIELIGITNAIREVIERGDYVPAAMQGPRTAWHVLSATEALPDSLKADSRAVKRRFSRHLEALRANSIIREGQMRRTSRHPVTTIELGGQAT